MFMLEDDLTGRCGQQILVFGGNAQAASSACRLGSSEGEFYLPILL